MYRKIKRYFESYFPQLSSVLVVLIYFFTPLDALICQGFEKLLEASITVSSIAVGFLATSKSILIALDDKAIVRNLKKIGHYGRLTDFFITGIYTCFILTLLSSVLLLIDFKQINVWKELLIALWLFIASYSTCACYRIIRLFSLILHKGAKQNPVD